MICFSSFVVLIIDMDLETFKITVLPLRQKMLNFSQRLVEDTAEAEDVVQEAFIKLWYIREKLDAYHSVEALAMQAVSYTHLVRHPWRRGSFPLPSISASISACWQQPTPQCSL